MRKTFVMIAHSKSKADNLADYRSSPHVEQAKMSSHAMNPALEAQSARTIDDQFDLALGLFADLNSEFPANPVFAH
jgi:hypothetical protein